MTEYAAHLRKDGMVQTVEDHCREAAIYAEKYGEKLSVAAIAKLEALLHDLGKMTEKFNGYIRGTIFCRRGEIDHSFAGARYIFELGKSMDCRRVSRMIARTILSHHGLHDWITGEGEDYFSQRLSGHEDYSEIVDRIGLISSEKELHDLLKEADLEYEQIRKKIMRMSSKSDVRAFYLGMLERLMQSILIDADRTNTADFMSACKTEGEYDTKALWQKMCIRIEETLKGFEQRTDRISLQRRSIAERCKAFAFQQRGICRLIVPTGGGKTLSSLRFAVEYCKTFEMKKIVYVAPFMSILEQNSNVIRKIAGEENFLEHHSNVIPELEDEELEEYELRAEKWDAPVIATTMVQFLQTLFSGRGSSVRRMHRLDHAVIIIDEIQSLPLKCIHMFNLAMNFLAKICGSTIVLCSATQPVLENVAYPLLCDSEVSMTGDYQEDFKLFRRTELVPALTDSGYTFREAADFCYEKYKVCQNLLVIVNTKAAATEIYKLLKEKNAQASTEDQAQILHLSTNMCPAHRAECIRKMRKILEDGSRVICVTTQLIEAGVDISFQCVVRSLAGLDHAAQAAGRCNRGGEFNRICPVYLINITEENLNKLQEIKASQGISRLILQYFQNEDLLSVKVMSAYFEKLFQESAGELSYPVKDLGLDTTLLEMLSLDNLRYQFLKKEELKYCAQAFKTAGGLFQVIEDCTVDLLIPYGEEAQKLIEALDSEMTPFEMGKLLRKAQKYVVGVYDTMERKLKEQEAVRMLKCGAMVLKREYYHPEYGVTATREKLEVLIQ